MSTTAQPYGADAVSHPTPTDVAHHVRDTLREVSERFAHASAHRRDRRAARAARRIPSADGVLQTIGDGFAFTARGRTT